MHSPEFAGRRWNRTGFLGELSGEEEGDVLRDRWFEGDQQLYLIPAGIAHSHCLSLPLKNLVNQGLLPLSHSYYIPYNIFGSYKEE